MDDLISRQAAIDAFTSKYCSSDFMDDGIIELFVETIQSVPSAQPVIITEHDDGLKLQSSNDTISRQAVLSYIDRILNQGTGKQKSFEFIRKYVERMPSAQPERKKGKE